MKILITGATGLVGKKLTKTLSEQNHQLVILTRDKMKAQKILPFNNISFYEWNDMSLLPPAEAFSQLDAVINLMGENIGDKRWSDDQKIKLRESRVNATVNIVKAIESNAPQLKVYIGASAIGIYPANSNETLLESSGVSNSFLGTLCHDWENASASLGQNIRRVIIRTGVVLEKNGGALKKMLPPFYMGVGGIIDNGKQVMSWIHIDDLVNLYIQALTNKEYVGAYNGCSSFPVTNYEFTKALGKAIHRPTIFPVPKVALKLAFGEMSSIILDSQKVISEKLPKNNFQFKYPKIDDAFGDLFKS
jgi:uncharacterized protein (TIGR01777 family)